MENESTLFNDFSNYVKSNLGILGVGAGVTVASAITGYLAGRSSTSKRKNRTKKGRSRDWRYASQQKHELSYRKRRKKLRKKSYQKSYKRKSGKIKYTKRGQPYIILKSGKARFIKGKRR